MFCKHCGTALEENAQFCQSCGASAQEQPVVVSAPAATPVSQPSPDFLPEENRPLSPWAYFGLQLLFAVPVVGLVFLIIFSISRANINRRNFARSYWCGLIIAAIVVVVALVITIAVGGGIEFYSRY